MTRQQHQYPRGHQHISRRAFTLGTASAAITGVVGHPGRGLAAARSAQGATEIEFWHGFAAHEITALQEMLDTRFAPAHPEIKVNATGGSTAEKTLAAIAGGNPPDLVLLPSPHAIGTWAHNDVIQALDAQIEESGLDLDVFIPAGIEQCKLDDSYYALPFVNFNNALYWNKDLFAAAGLDPDVPPQSIEELLDFAEKLTVKDGDRITQIGVLPTLYLQEMAWRFGGDWYDAATSTVTANTEANLRALQFELDVANRVGGVDAVQRFQGSLPTGGGAADNPFYQGKIAIMVDGCWQVEFIRQYASDLNYGVSAVPAPPDVPDGATINDLMTNPMAIPQGAKHVPEAWELLKFLATDVETSREFAKIIANIPQVTEASTTFTDDPHLKVFVDLSQSAGARHFPVLPITEEYTAAIATLESAVMTGETDPQAGLDQLQADMETALEKAEG
jgi:multiple sugar transport system substrate-binding protein